MRLPEYDYAQPATYFVTICVADRACLFGAVSDGRMIPNPLGAAVGETWRDLAKRFRPVDLDAFVVMPNHARASLRRRRGRGEPPLRPLAAVAFEADLVEQDLFAAGRFLAGALLAVGEHDVEALEVLERL